MALSVPVLGSVVVNAIQPLMLLVLGMGEGGGVLDAPKIAIDPRSASVTSAAASNMSGLDDLRLQTCRRGVVRRARGHRVRSWSVAIARAIERSRRVAGARPEASARSQSVIECSMFMAGQPPPRPRLRSAREPSSALPVRSDGAT